MKSLLAAASLALAIATVATLNGEGQTSPPGQTNRPTPASRPAPRPVAAVAPRTGPAPDAAFLNQYCATCHNTRLKSGGLAFDTLDLGHPETDAGAWEKAVRKLRTGMMPPDGAPKPTAATREAFTSSLEASLDRAAALRLDPGAPALHRLNRAEYANVIRDLLSLDIDATTLLPPDDAAAGFDNIADVLGVSPALIDGYAAAATKISRLAVGDPAVDLDRVTYRVAGDVSQDSHVEGLPLGTRGGLIVHHTFPLDAEYDLQVTQAGGNQLGAPRGGGPRVEDLDVAIDGTRVALQGRGQAR